MKIETSQSKILGRIAFITILSVLISCNNGAERVTVFFKSTHGTQSERLSLELAYTESMRTLGLMYRHRLGKNEGMLFVFPDTVQRNFWMKNTPLPLDIIFLDAEQQIVHVAANTNPYSEKEVPSLRPSKYVVELNAGRSAELGIVVGSQLVVEGQIPHPR